jgi:hypothetical protein
MRLTRLSLGALTLLLLVAVPANAAPTLHKGSQASYNLSVSISLIQSCGPPLSSTVSTGTVCPMIAMVYPNLILNGTLGWAVTELSAATASLNVTRDLTTSSDGVVTPVIHHAGSFNESIDLATRIASILPFIEPEMEQALQIARTNVAASLPVGTTWTSTMSAIDGTMIRQPLHTMWWVNGPLKVNDSIPVLVFPTNVTGSTSVDLGGTIGTRTAWILSFPDKIQSLVPSSPLATTTALLPTADNFGFALTFNYDQTSDLLLSANADLHLGFSQETTIQPNPCNSSATIVCPASSPVSVVMEFGINVHASLRLTSTTLDLSQRLTPTTGSDSNGGSSSSTVTGTGPINGQGPGSGSGPGSTSGSNSGPGSGNNLAPGGTTTGAGQPPSNPAQSKPAPQSAGLLPWMYGILGIVATLIVASRVWFARRQIKKAPSQVPPSQQPMWAP